MNDRIDFGSEPWQAIPRRVLRDSNLTARAKGGLVTLLSHEEGWVRSCIAVLMKECKVGRKQAQAIMAELREEGYAELVKEHEGNLIKTRYIVRAVPESATFQAQLVASSDLPVSGPSRSGSTGNGAAVVDPQDVDPLDEEPLEAKALPLAATRRDELFEAIAEVCNIDWRGLTDAARGPLVRALAQIRAVDGTPDEVRHRAAIYRGIYSVELTPSALAKHWPSLRNARPRPIKRDPGGERIREAIGEGARGGTANGSERREGAVRALGG